MNSNKRVNLLKALAFPASAAFMFGVGVTAIHADDEVADPANNQPIATTSVDENTTNEVLGEATSTTENTNDAVADTTTTTDTTTTDSSTTATDTTTDNSATTDNKQAEPTTTVTNQPVNTLKKSPAKVASAQSYQVSTVSDVTYVAWIGNQGYETLEEAVNAAKSGDIITLGEGKYTLYKKGAETKGKDLTFIGLGADKTAWGIGATIPDPDKFGTEYNGDYSFDGAGTITFKNMTLQSGTVDYLGFIRADNTVVENCTINGKTCYWGYKSAIFKNTTFNCPEVEKSIFGFTYKDYDYALWTYCSTVMTFDGCVFNSHGKVINVYRDGGAGAEYVINFKDCTINNEGNGNKQVLGINDSVPSGQSYIINISGKNVINGTVPVDKYTCSRLFGFGDSKSKNAGNTTVNIEGVTVFKDGKSLMHEHTFNTGSYSNGKSDGTDNKYTEGYKDDTYTIEEGEWVKQEDGTYKRHVTKTCDYCGHKDEWDETNEVPEISAEDKTIKANDEFDPMNDVTASDKEDGDLTGKIEIVENNVDVTKPGTYTITYKVVDSLGQETTKTITITVEEVPVDPETPDEPKKPETPEQPKTPETPKTPESPKTPETPSTPEETKKEETTSNVEQTSVKTTVAAAPATTESTGTQTGVETNLISLGGALIISALGAVALRKKEDDE